MSASNQYDKFFQNLLQDSKALLDTVFKEQNDFSTGLQEELISPALQEIIENINIAISVITNGSQDTFIRFSSIQKAGDVGYWDIPIALGNPLAPNNPAHWTDDFRRLLGFTDEKDFPNIINSWISRVHPEDVERVYKAFSSHMLDFTGNTPYDIEYRFKKKNGEYNWYRGLSTMVKSGDGVPARVSGIMYDINEQKVKEEELQETLSRFNLLSKTSEEGRWVINLSHAPAVPLHPDTVVWWSPQYRNLLGVQDEHEFPNVLGSWMDRIYPKDKEKVLKAYLSHIQDKSGNTPFSMDYRMQFWDGSYVWFHCTADTERDANGKPLYSGGVIRKVDYINPEHASKKLQIDSGAMDDGAMDTTKENQRNYFETIVGKDPRFLQVLSKALTAARADVPILICGENGTGKEVIAKAIHCNSKRSKKPFICVNCAAIPEHLLESELFGYEGGSFTGARSEGKQGKFEMAQGGTLFLDEIADMSVVMQAKILRAIQENEIEKIGRSRQVKIDVRIITATNKPIAEMLKNNTFRIDLYYRLNVVELLIPPVRQRGGDSILLAKHFLSSYNKLNKTPLCFSEGVLAFFRTHSWPGNVREIRNCVEYMAIMCTEEEIGLDDLPIHIADSQTIAVESHEEPKLRLRAASLKEALQAVEIEAYKNAINICANKNEAIKMLGISRRTFYSKLKEYNLDAGNKVSAK